MTDEPINGIDDLRTALADIVERYVQHLDWHARSELTTVRVEASGPGISLTYAEHATEPPRLMVSIGEWTNRQ